jgi:hypothetical protein
VLRRRPRHRHDHPAGLNRFGHRSWALAALAVAAAAAAIAPACGDDDGGSDGEGSSKQAFVTEAEQICRDQALLLKVQLAREFGRAKISDGELVAFTKSTAIPNIEHQLERLQALPQPEEDRSTLERYYVEYQGGIDQLRRDPALVTERSVPPAFTEANRLAREYGIDDCVR